MPRGGQLTPGPRAPLGPIFDAHLFSCYFLSLCITSTKPYVTFFDDFHNSSTKMSSTLFGHVGSYLGDVDNVIQCSNLTHLLMVEWTVSSNFLIVCPFAVIFVFFFTTVRFPISLQIHALLALPLGFQSGQKILWYTIEGEISALPWPSSFSV